MKKILTALSMIFAIGLVLVSNLGLVSGTSDGMVWTRYAGNPLDVGISDVGDPWVIYDDTIFRMWYCSFGSDLVRRIYYATSLNGIDWTPHGVVLEPGASGSWDDRHVGPPTVVFDGTGYRMWYTGVGHTSGLWGMVGYATSSNGIDWIKNEANPVLTPGGNGGWDDWNIADISAVFNGSHYLMWYAGQAYEDSQESMGIALSTDGIFWTKYVANPVMTPGPSSFDDRHVTPGGVVRNGTHYLMWYTGQGWSAPDRMGGDRIGLAVSSDGFLWAKDENNPALDWGAAGSWETYVRHASVVEKDCGLMMWYQGIIPDPEVKSGKIGLACAVTPITWEYTFEDPRRDTILKISTDDKDFHFIAPDKDFGVKHDPNMKILKRVITICYEDSEMRLVATAIDDNFDFCSAVAWDKQTGKMYLLIDKPNWRHLRYLEFL